MTRKKIPANVIAVTEGGPITPEMILGDVVFYLVPERPVSRRRVRELMVKHKLDEDQIPATRKAVNVFEDACRAQQSKRSNGNGAGEVAVDRVMQDREVCIYQITRRVRDLDNRLIEHEKSMKVTFDKADKTLKFEPLERSHRAALKDLKEKIQARYESHMQKLPGQTVRNMLRGYLESLNAETLKESGGVYFVAKQHHETLVSLRDFMAELYERDGSALFHLIPLANDETQREMLEKRFTINTMTAIDEAMTTIAERLTDSSRAPRKDMVQNGYDQRAELAKKIAEYKELLGTELTSVDEKVKLLDQQLQALSEAAVPA